MRRRSNTFDYWKRRNSGPGPKRPIGKMTWPPIFKSSRSCFVAPEPRLLISAVVTWNPKLMPLDSRLSWPQLRLWVLVPYSVSPPLLLSLLHLSPLSPQCSHPPLLPLRAGLAPPLFQPLSPRPPVESPVADGAEVDTRPPLRHTFTSRPSTTMPKISSYTHVGGGPAMLELSPLVFLSSAVGGAVYPQPSLSLSCSLPSPPSAHNPKLLEGSLSRSLRVHMSLPVLGCRPSEDQDAGQVSGASCQFS